MEAKFKIYPGLVIAVFICAGVILLGIYPYRPNSLIGLAVLLLLSVPVAFIYEMLGKKLGGFNDQVQKVQHDAA